VPWLFIVGLFVGHAASAAKWDVKDTHDRLDRIYKKLGIDEPEEEKKSDSWCEPKEKKREEPREPRRWRAPRMPAWLGYFMIIAILAAMLVPLFFVLKNSFAGDTTRRSDEEDEEDEEEGPTEVRRGPWVVDLSECRRLLAQGKLAEAFASLHRLTLLGLSRLRHLTLDETTTNWEYVRRLVSKPQLRDVLSKVTLAAEQSVLGRSPPGAARYEALEQLVLQHVQEGRP